MMFYTTAINGVFAALIAGALIFTGGGVTKDFLLDLMFYIIITPIIAVTLTRITVSYTHLDVYKRQMLVTVPLAFFAFTIMMKNFNKLYADYMESSNYVNGVIVEYVEGIEVIKAFNQSSRSYEKFSKAVQRCV